MLSTTPIGDEWNVVETMMGSGIVSLGYWSTQELPVQDPQVASRETKYTFIIHEKFTELRVAT